jgi:hypothetical protein
LSVDWSEIPDAQQQQVVGLLYGLARRRATAALGYAQGHEARSMAWRRAACRRALRGFDAAASALDALGWGWGAAVAPVHAEQARDWLAETAPIRPCAVDDEVA